MNTTYAPSIGSQVVTRIELVTPEIAQGWLQYNTHNRTASMDRVRQFADDMLHGRWEFNAQTITFDREGRLIDGQHRLMAVVESGIAVEMLVVTGLSPSSQMTIDIGAPRSAGQQLSLSGIANARNASSVAVCLIRLDRHGDKVWTQHEMPSKSEQIGYVLSRSEELGYSVAISQHAYKTTRINKTGYAALCVLAHDAGYGAEFDAFHAGFASGTSLTPGDPRVALRNYAVRLTRANGRTGAWGQQQDVAVILKAFNAYRLGREVKLLRFTRDELPMPTV